MIYGASADVNPQFYMRIKLEAAIKDGTIENVIITEIHDYSQLQIWGEYFLQSFRNLITVEYPQYLELVDKYMILI